jgi:hypothetical protein
LTGAGTPALSWRPSIPWWAWPLLIAGTIAIYLNSLPNAFHNDDISLILENPSIHSSSLLNHLRSATVGPAHLSTRGYRPLVMMTFSLNYAWGGSTVSGYHAVNIGLHAVAAFLVTVVIWCLTANRIAAILGGLVFAVHPIHTEAVNYVTARSSILYTVWSLLTVILFIRFRQTGRVLPLAFALISFAAALLSKETAIVVPLLLVAYDLYFRRIESRTATWWVAPYLGFFSIGVAFMWVRQLAMGTFGPQVLTDNPWTVLLTFVMVFKKTLQGQLMPLQLSAFHPKDYTASLADPGVLAACLVFAGMALLVVGLRRRARLVSFGLLWFTVGLLPIAALAMITEMDLYQENRGYFSSVGLVLIAGPLLAACWGEGRFRERMTARVIVGGLILAMGIAVVQRNVVWKDPVTLWTDVVAKYPNSPSSHMILARAYRLSGDRASAIAVLAQATEHLPPNPILYNDLCALYLQEGALGDAGRACLSAVRRDPDFPTPYFNLGMIYWKTDRRELAVEAFEVFLKLAGNQPKFTGLAQEARDRLRTLQPAPPAR